MFNPCAYCGSTQEKFVNIAIDGKTYVPVCKRCGRNKNYDLIGMANEIVALTEENTRLREALEFYADATNYGALIPVSACGDRGRRARAALRKDNINGKN